jgi:hypothetical protein
MRCFGYDQESTFVSLNQERTGEDTMTNPNPMPVGWWLHSNGNAMRVVFDDRTVGEESSVPILAYSEKGVCHWYHPASFVRRLPDDAGFDWKPEPEYPKYWTAMTPGIAYLRLERNGNHYCVNKDGTETGPHDWNRIVHEGRTQLTKAEAEARIVKPIPEIQFDPKTFTSDWGPFEKIHSLVPSESPSNQQLFEMIANLRDQMDRMNKKTSPEVHANRIPVRLYWYDGNVVARYGHTPPTDPSFVEIKLDPERHISDSGFYVEGTGT